jgi:hypothetical protein
MEKRKKSCWLQSERKRKITAFSLHPDAAIEIEKQAERMGLNQSQWVSWFVLTHTGRDPVTGQKVKKAS